MKYSKEDIVVLDEESIKPYQAVILKIARDIVDFFDKNGIEYSLSGGSILGAIRHKGFIPWDDDIDLNMPRKDYNKMLELFDEELGDKYYLQTPQKNPELGLMVTQIRKKGTIARRKYDWNSEKEICGISIDIYIMENLYDNRLMRAFQQFMSMGLSFCLAAVRFYNNRGIPREIQDIEGRQFNYSKSKMLCGRFFKIIPLNKWIDWCDYWYSKCKDENSKGIVIPTGRKHFSHEMYKRSDMCIYRKVPFETGEFNVPVEAEKYLKIFYGDYMKLPPKEKREKHVFLELKY